MVWSHWNLAKEGLVVIVPCVFDVFQCMKPRWRMAEPHAEPRAEPSQALIRIAVHCGLLSTLLKRTQLTDYLTHTT